MQNVSSSADEAAALCWRMTGVALWCLSIVIGLGLLSTASVSQLYPDSIQHLSTASNMLSGDGIRTSIAYFEMHFQYGALPAPQTVWPPGGALVAAAAGLSFGISGWSLIITSTLCFALTALVIFHALRILGIAPAVAISAASLWLVTPWSWKFALQGMTEAPFALASASALYCLASAYLTAGRSRLKFLSLGGCSVAVALLFRYQGLLLAAGLVAGIAVIRSSLRMRDAAREAGYFLLPVAVMMAVLFGRNFLLTGALTGGQTTAVDPQSPLNALRLLVWNVDWLFVRLLHLTDVSNATRLIFLSLTIWLFVATGFRVVAVRRNCETNGQQVAASVVAVSCAAYIVVTLLSLLSSGVQYSAFFPSEARYLEILLPALIVLTAIAVAHLQSRFRSGMATLNAVLVAAVLTLGISRVVGDDLSAVVKSNMARTEMVRLALQSRAQDGRTVREHLAEIADRRETLLTSEAHAVYLLTRTNVVGLTDAPYTREIWDEATTLRLVDRFGAAYVLILPRELTKRHTVNQSFFRRLAAGERQRRLREVVTTEEALLLRVVPEDDQLQGNAGP
jgi:hypothetical protein